MKRVSEESQAILTQLVAWEVLGATEVDPKVILRETPLTDLSIISSNIKKSGREMKNFVCVSMVEAELMYKTGLLQGDWGYKRCEQRVTLTYSLASFQNVSHVLPLLEIGAEA